jgi:hypothetical protein
MACNKKDVHHQGQHVSGPSERGGGPGSNEDKGGLDGGPDIEVPTTGSVSHVPAYEP